MKKKFNQNETTLTFEELEIFKKSSEDILEFINYVKIFHPKRGMIPAGPALFKKQKDVLKELSLNWEDKFHLILSARQSGKSTIMLILILWIITFKQSKVIGILANKKSSASSLFRRLSNMYHTLPKMFRLSEEIGDSKTELELSDGTIVFCGPTSASGLRSESISLLILEEFAFVPPAIAADFWQSNYPTIEASGSLLVVSTPNGKDNVFYDLYKKAKKKTDKKWRLLTIHWSDVFNRGEKWRKEKIAALSVGGKNGINSFNQEYNNSFDVVTSSIRFFDQEAVAKFRPGIVVRRYIPNKDKNVTIEMYKDIETTNPFFVGVDISEGKKLNFSSLAGFEARKVVDDYGEVIKLEQAFQLYDSGLLPDEFFNYTFKFLTEELNDRWYLIFERNDIGRVWDIRFRDLMDELVSGVISVKNNIFKDMLNDKFEGNVTLMINYLKSRVYKQMGSNKQWEYGLKVNYHNNQLLKTTFKRVIDDGEVIIKNPYIIQEAKTWEDKKGSKDVITFDELEGWSHYDGLTSVKMATMPLTKRALVQTIFGLRDLSQVIQNKFGLDYLRGRMIANVRRAGKDKDFAIAEQMRDEFTIPGTVPIEIDIPDSTKGWKRFGGYFKPKT